jgi:hypothetical protein
MTRNRREAFDTQLDGCDVNIEFTRTTTYSRENYGADADGNRGVMMTMLDEDRADEIEIIRVDDMADGSRESRTPYAQLSQTEQGMVTEALDAYLSENEPDDFEDEDVDEDEDDEDFFEDDFEDEDVDEDDESNLDEAV